MGKKIAVLLNVVQPSKRLLRLHGILYKSCQINKYETTEKYLDTVLFQTTVAGDNFNSSGYRLNILDCLLFSIYIELHDSRKLLVVVLHYRETKGFAICRAEGKQCQEMHICGVQTKHIDPLILLL